MKKKMIFAILAVLAVSTLLFGCANQKSTEPESVTQESPEMTTSTSEFDEARFAVLEESHQKDQAEILFPNATFTTFTSVPDIYAALKEGAADYTVLDNYTAYAQIGSDPSFYIASEDLAPGAEDLAIAINKDNVALKEKIDASIAKLEKEGTLEKIREIWSVTDGNYEPMSIKPSNGENGTLRVAVCANIRPLSYKFNDSITGLEPQLILSIATDMGMKVEYVEVPFNELLSTVVAGNADCAISGLTVTPEREEIIMFSVPYAEHHSVILGYRK